MAIAHAQSMGNGVTAAPGGSHTFSPSANQLTNGNTLTLILTEQGSNVTSITDNHSNAWTIQTDFLNSGLDVAVATCIPADAGHMLTTSDTITVHSSPSGYGALWFMDEWSGLTQGTDGSVVTGTTATVSMTTSSTPDLVIAAYGLFHSGAVTFTPTGGWTGSAMQDVGSPGSYHLCWEYLNTPSVGSQSTSGASFTGTPQVSAVLLAIKGAGSASGTSKLRALLGVG